MSYDAVANGKLDTLLANPAVSPQLPLRTALPDYRILLSGGFGAPPSLSSLAGSSYGNTSGAVCIPFTVDAAQTLANVHVANGSTVAGNQFDVGIYGPTGTKIASGGGPTQGTANRDQAVSFNLALAKGRYFLAFVCGSATMTFWGYTLTATGLYAISTLLGIKTAAATAPFGAGSLTLGDNSGTYVASAVPLIGLEWA